MINEKCLVRGRNLAVGYVNFVAATSSTEVCQKFTGACLVQGTSGGGAGFAGARRPAIQA